MNRTRCSRICALLLAAAALAAPAAAAPATGPTRLFTGADLFNLEWATDPQISPDGRTIAYVRQSNDIMTDRARATIWLVDVATGQQRPLLAGSGSYFSPRWSPDGTRLAYVAAEGGGPQLYVRWMASGESARITGLPEQPERDRLVAGRPPHRLFDVRSGRRRRRSARRRPSPRAPNGPTRCR